MDDVPSEEKLRETNVDLINYTIGEITDTYFFETPKVNRDTIDKTKFEFVLVNTERFEGVDPDSGAFREHFDRCKSGKFVTSFAKCKSQLVVMSQLRASI